MPFNVDYPKELRKNKEYRLHVLQEAEEDEQLQQLLRTKATRDILYFVNVFCWTYDPRKDISQIPFITYEYQDDTLQNMVKCIQEGRDVAIEKSRDMGASWMMVVLQVYGYLNGWSSLYGSYKEDYVDILGDMDSHFERIRYVLELLPGWLLPSDTITGYMKVSSNSNNNTSISGDAGANFGTGGRRKFVIMDEFALWQHDKKAFRKTKDISRCRIICGTPEGKFNVYGQIMTQGEDYKHLDLERIRLHWTLHPEKTYEWYEEEKKKRTRLDVAKELDISYEDSVTGAVYPEFTDRVRVERDLAYNPDLPLFTAWDFGRDMNAVLWIQKNYYTNQLFIVDCIQLKDKPIEYMTSFVTGNIEIDESTGMPFPYTDDEVRMIAKHSSWKSSYAMHCGDPYNASSRTTNATSSIKQKLGDYGIHIVTNRKDNLEERIRKAHQVLPRLVVKESLVDFIQAMVQSRYPESSLSATREKTKPIHDVNSHFRTAFEYFCSNEPTNNPYKKKKWNGGAKKAINYLTGETM